MRSSPSGPDPLDPGPAGFAHRGLHAGFEVPENSIAACEAAIRIGAGIECDLRLTADGQIILFHDPDANRLCGSPLAIERSRWTDVSALRIGAHCVPTLEQLLDLVGDTVPLLLEVKVRRNVRRWGQALARSLAGRRGRFAVMSFDPRLVGRMATLMPEVRRGLVLQERRSAVERRLYMHLARPQFLAVELGAAGRPWVQHVRRTRPVYAWTIRTAEERAQATVHADALIWEADGRPGT
jgi:glycerophosphoryl diester phosphodiesterase